MKKLLLGILLLVGSLAYGTDYSSGAKIKNPCSWPEAPMASITGATTGTNRVELVALSGSKKVYVCSMTVIGVSGTSTPTFSLVEGTGTACATGTATKVQAFPVGTAIWQFAPMVSVGTAGYALCYLQTGTSPVANYQINYIQQ